MDTTATQNQTQGDKMETKKPIQMYQADKAESYHKSGYIKDLEKKIISINAIDGLCQKLINTILQLLCKLNPDKKIDEVIQHVPGTELHALTSGPIPPNPSELLNSNRMNGLMKRFEEMYDIIIYDMPPVTSVTDAQIMAAKSDGVVLVIRHGVAQKDSVLNAKELLEMVNANILGVVFNGVEKKTDYSYYGYGYTNEGEAK